MKHKLYKYILVCASLLTNANLAMQYAPAPESITLPTENPSACAKCTVERAETMINYLNACTACLPTPSCNGLSSSVCPQDPQDPQQDSQIERAQKSSCEQRVSTGPMCKQAQKIAAYCNGSWLDIVILQLYQKNLSPSLAYQQLVYVNLKHKMMLCQKLASGTAVSALPPQLKAVAAQSTNADLVSICSKGFIPSATQWTNDSLETQYNDDNFQPPVPTWDSEEACVAAPTNPTDPNYTVCQSVSISDADSCQGCCLLYSYNGGSQTSDENNCCLPANYPTAPITCSKQTSAPVSCLIKQGLIAPGAETICKEVDTLYTALLNNAGVLQVLWNSYLELGYNSNMSVISEFKKIMDWKLSTWQGPNGATANSVNNYLGQLLATTVNDFPEFATGQLANPNLFPMQVTFKEYLAYYNAHPDEREALVQSHLTTAKTTGANCNDLTSYCLNSTDALINNYCIANIQVGTQNPAVYPYTSVPKECIPNSATVFTTIGTNISGAITTAEQSCSQISEENQAISQAIQGQAAILANCNKPTSQISICLEWQKLIKNTQIAQMMDTVITFGLMAYIMLKHGGKKPPTNARQAGEDLKAKLGEDAKATEGDVGELAAEEATETGSQGILDTFTQSVRSFFGRLGIGSLENTVNAADAAIDAVSAAADVGEGGSDVPIMTMDAFLDTVEAA